MGQHSEPCVKATDKFKAIKAKLSVVSNSHSKSTRDILKNSFKLSKTKRPPLQRYASDPDAHSGAGHGGRAKGAGALPFTNAHINIHDHFEDERRLRQRADSGFEDADIDILEHSISYIYGDEDGEHHKLPQYQSPVASPKENAKGFETNVFVAVPLKEVETTGTGDTENTSSNDTVRVAANSNSNGVQSPVIDTELIEE